MLAQNSSIKPGTYFALLFVAFIGFIGVSVPFPAMVMVFLDAGSPFLSVETSANYRHFITGCALGAYPLMQAFGSPLLGQLSDRYGRKKVLLVSLAVSSVGYFLTSAAVYGGLTPLFFLGRMICGLAQGNIAIALSTASDLSSGATKKKFFANINAGAYCAFLVGPLLGGWLGNYSQSGLGYYAVFAFSSLCTGLAVCVSLWLFPNLPARQEDRVPFSLFRDLKAIGHSFTNSALRSYFIIAAFLFFGVNIFLEFNNVFFVSAFSATVGEVGFFVSYFSIFSIGAQLCFNAKIVHGIAPIKLLTGAMVCLIVSILLLVSAELKVLIWFVLPVVAASFAISKTSFQLLVSENVDGTHQGKSLGLAEGLDVFCDAAAAICGGLLASLDYRLPLNVAALFILVALAFTWIFFVRKAPFLIPRSGKIRES